MNRRSIIGLVALAVAGLIGLGVFAVLGTDGDRRIGALGDDGATPAESWLLRVDTVPAGRLESVETCGPELEIVYLQQSHDPTGGTASSRGLRYPSCVLKFKPFQGVGGAGLVAWLNQTLNGQVVRRNLAVEGFDASGEGLVRLDLQNSLIRQIVFPRLTPAVGADYVVTVTVQPETVVRHESFNGNIFLDEPEEPTGFRFKLASQVLSGVRGIGPIVVDQQLTAQLATTPSGGTRVTYTPGQLTVQQVKLSLDRDPQSPVADWFESFVLQGQMGTTQHRQGTLELLGANQQPGLTLSLPSLGISGATDNADLTERTYSLYLRQSRTLALSLPPVTSSPPPPPPPPPTTPPPPPPTTAPPPPPPPPPTTSPPPPPPPPPPAEAAPLAPPKEVTFETDGGVIVLRWSPVEGAEKYAILYGEGSPEGYKELTTVEATEHKFEMPRSMVFYFVVRAINSEGASENSEPVEIDTG